MSERCEIPTGPDRAARGHTREHAAVETFDQELDGLDSCARKALGERVGAEKHRRADDLIRVGLAHPARMAAEQAKLQLLDLVVWDRLRDEAAESRVDAVGVLPHTLDERASRLHSRPRFVRERHRHTMNGDLPHVLDPKVVPRQGRARDHAASLAQDEHPRERILIARKPLRGRFAAPKALARKPSGAWAPRCPVCAAGSRPRGRPGSSRSSRRARRSGPATGPHLGAGRPLLGVDVDGPFDLVLVAEELRLDLSFSVGVSVSRAAEREDS